MHNIVEDIFVFARSLFRPGEKKHRRYKTVRRYFWYNKTDEYLQIWKDVDIVLWMLWRTSVNLAAYTSIICNCRLKSNISDNFVGHYWWDATCCTVVKKSRAIFQKALHRHGQYIRVLIFRFIGHRWKCPEFC